MQVDPETGKEIIPEDTSAPNLVAGTILSESVKTSRYTLQVGKEQQQKILTWAWLIYNERVVTVEEYVANPTFTMLAQGGFPGVSDYSCLKALKQCLIDEHFHSLIHITAIVYLQHLMHLLLMTSPHGMLF